MFSPYRNTAILKSETIHKIIFGAARMCPETDYSHWKSASKARNVHICGRPIKSQFRPLGKSASHHAAALCRNIMQQYYAAALRRSSMQQHYAAALCSSNVQQHSATGLCSNKTDRQTDRQAGRQTDRQTDRQTIEINK